MSALKISENLYPALPPVTTTLTLKKSDNSKSQDLSPRLRIGNPRDLKNRPVANTSLLRVGELAKTITVPGIAKGANVQ